VNSALLVYDCKKRDFISLGEVSQAYRAYGDLGAMRDGYYYSTSRFIDGVLHGEYQLVRNGNQARISQRNLDVHDAVFDADGRLLIKYVPDRDEASCFGKTPLHFELAQEDPFGKIVWSWSSKKVIATAMNVSTPSTMDIEHIVWWKKVLRPPRHCFTSLLARIADIEVPRFTWLSSSYPTFQYTYNDYVHANSIQRRKNGNVVVSARHLDTVFEIERTTGQLAWVLPGPKAKMSGFRIEGDPFTGFSHQHTATIYGDDILLLFDNGNLFENRPSRAVMYRMDWRHGVAKFVKHFLEPNGKQRPATGSAYIIDKQRLIVGWGYLYPSDRQSVQRGVSIFDIDSGQETFSINFSPGYDSYRAKWQPK
jgi:hypothetical protein